MRNRNHPQRRADARRRQATGVAVGQQTASRFDQFAPRAGDGVAELFVFLNQTQRFCRQSGNKILLPQRYLHAVEIVHQIHRGRT
ncbi:hypothetical protein D3C71_1590620 [compost metagenome]